MSKIKKPDLEILKKKIIYPLIADLQKEFRYLKFNSNGKRHPYDVFTEEFDHYYSKAIAKMNDHKLDRHKLAAIICVSVYKAQFLQVDENVCKDNSRFYFCNEYLALHVSLNSMRMYILKSFFEKTENMQYAALKDNAVQCFKMEFPDMKDLICDKQCYSVNLSLAMKKCFYEYDCFDIWSYAFIFFHLEEFNCLQLKQFCEDKMPKSFIIGTISPVPETQQ